jgi:hypothetical protein
MSDAFASFADHAAAPAMRALAVVPHDTIGLAAVPKALFVGTGGNLVLRGAGGGADVLFKNVASGAVLPIRASHVRATGTTAADLVALI